MCESLSREWINPEGPDEINQQSRASLYIKEFCGKCVLRKKFTAKRSYGEYETVGCLGKPPRLVRYAYENLGECEDKKEKK